MNRIIPVWHKSGKGIVAKPWLTREIRDSIRFKEEAYKLAGTKQQT